MCQVDWGVLLEIEMGALKARVLCSRWQLPEIKIMS
jgi:hypothetical protein